MKKLLVLLAIASATTPALANTEEGGASFFNVMGPSIHLGGGARFKKAPDLDLYDSPIAGLKISPFGFRMSRYAALSLLAFGVNYIGDSRVAFSLSPLIFYHTIGLGIGFDFYSTRPDRTGGPFGVSLNLDVLMVIRAVQARGVPD